MWLTILEINNKMLFRFSVLFAVYLRVCIGQEVARLLAFQPQSTISEGLMFNLICSTNAGDKPLFFQWTKNGNVLKTSPRNNNFKINTSESFSQISINNVSYSDSGDYSCIVRNTYGEDATYTQLFVTVPLKWSKIPNDTVNISDKITSLECGANGIPKPSIKWIDSNGNEIEGEVLNLVLKNSSSTYECVADNGVDQPLRKEVKILVNGKPLFDATICGDWEPYKYEKCFKLFDTMESYNEAINSCNQYNASLVTITTQEEQQFIENYLFATNKVVDNVWIGLKYNESKYQWTNDLETNYTNWSKQSPKNRAELCVQIIADEVSVGKWYDISCVKRNHAFCQYVPNITTPMTILNTQKQLSDTLLQQNVTLNVIESMTQQLENATQQLSYELDQTILNLKDVILNSATNESHFKSLRTTVDHNLIMNSRLINASKKLENAIIQLNKTSVNKIKEIEKLIVISKLTKFTENNKRKALLQPNQSTRDNSLLNRSEAMALCGEYNATLVEIESEQKQQLVESFLVLNSSLDYDYFWLGGYYDFADYKYKWLDSGNQFNYTNWIAFQSYNLRERPYVCVTIGYTYSYKRSDYGNWQPCLSVAKVVCELTFNF